MSSPPKPPRSPRSFPLALDRVAPVGKSFVSPPLVARGAEPVAPRSKPDPSADRQLLRPQRPLQQAAQDRTRPSPPLLHPGPDLERVRRQMVLRLRELGLRDERVIEALSCVPRHHFVDSGLVTQAYEDTSLPIGFGQTISKPSVVARMLELLCAGQRNTQPFRVLEIGTGCGYQAALLGLLARQVVSIERLQPLHAKACELLASLGQPNLRLLHGDGRLGHAPLAPYEGIIAAAGGEELPSAWLDQLAPGGRLVAPLALSGSSGQVLMVVDRLPDGRFVQTRHEAVHFVPLKSGVV